MNHKLTTPLHSGLGRTATDPVSPARSATVREVMDLYLIDNKYSYSLSPFSPPPTQAHLPGNEKGLTVRAEGRAHPPHNGKRVIMNGPTTKPATQLDYPGLVRLLPILRHLPDAAGMVTLEPEEAERIRNLGFQVQAGV